MPTRATSLQNSTLTGLTREIGSQYDKVKLVADNINGVVALAEVIEAGFDPQDLVDVIRADRWLASQNVAAMVYTGSYLTKIQYNNATNVDYEVLAYTSGNLTSIQHYVGSVLKGTTTLSYTSGNLVSAIFVGV